ncbi:flavodoxin domain-containing protein [Paenibacillus solisilvae]|uniref:Flavodoxin domain-containing protein n=1 Tax=Paenibacillus solisilvae TaxID=2486751 RepID=A0ABW0VZD8_9BACL
MEPPAPAVPEDSAKKSRVTILWASQTGNAEGAANECAKQLQAAGHEIRLISMDAYSMTDLPSERNMLLVASTFGAGDPPDNGETFWQSLQAESVPRLSELRYAVLAFGDTNYDLFCGFGRNLDTRLEQLGAQRLMNRVDCDTDFQEQVDAWMPAVQKALNEEKPNQTGK